MKGCVGYVRLLMCIELCDQCDDEFVDAGDDTYKRIPPERELVVLPAEVQLLW